MSSSNRELLQNLSEAFGDENRKLRINKSGNTLCDEKTKYVVNGVFLERRSEKSSVFVRHLVFPLTSLTFNISLDYGERITQSPFVTDYKDVAIDVVRELSYYKDSESVFKVISAEEFLSFLVRFRRSNPLNPPQKRFDIATFTALTGDLDRARTMLSDMVETISWYENSFRESLQKFKGSVLTKRSEQRIRQATMLKNFIIGEVDFDDYLTVALAANTDLVGL